MMDDGRDANALAGFLYSKLSESLRGEDYLWQLPHLAASYAGRLLWQHRLPHEQAVVIVGSE
jgi:ABC-type cobalamin transport system permease subunit